MADRRAEDGAQIAPRGTQTADEAQQPERPSTQPQGESASAERAAEPTGWPDDGPARTGADGPGQAHPSGQAGHRADPAPAEPVATAPSARATHQSQAQPRKRAPRTRKARLRLTRVDPWSVMKTAFLLSIAFGIVVVVAVGVVWSVLGAAGVWSSINQTVADVLGGQPGSRFDITQYLGTSRVMGFTMVVAAVDVVLITAIATLGAFLYNLAAALLGGLEVTLTEQDR